MSSCNSPIVAIIWQLQGRHVVDNVVLNPTQQRGREEEIIATYVKMLYYLGGLG
jgi:hypothetical protein